MPFREVDTNLRHTLRLFAAHQARGEVLESAGLTVACAGVRFSMFNAALLNSPVSRANGGLDRLASDAAALFESRGLSWSFWICEEWLDRHARSHAADVLAKHRLERASMYTGMVAGQLRPAEHPLPPLEFRRVSDASTRLDFCNIGCTCFHVPFDWFNEIFEREGLWTGGFEAWVGYRQGEAATTAAAVSSDDVLGIYNVATLPQFRNRGCAEAVVRHVVGEASLAAGPRDVVLQSTAQGYKLYAKMGFRPVSRFAIFATR